MIVGQVPIVCRMICGQSQPIAICSLMAVVTNTFNSPASLLPQYSRALKYNREMPIDHRGKHECSLRSCCEQQIPSQSVNDIMALRPRTLLAGMKT
jgi:hypothetical protein